MAQYSFTPVERVRMQEVEREGEKVKRGTDIKTVVKHWYDVNMTRLQVYFCRHLQIHAREKQVSRSQCVFSNLLIRTPK